ncbi:hypothetical protein K461DRAFT_282768 [Myriangium duriaei CBS 260.36]|uniref:Arrestin-like N-terminal domain-containing protein n=1 Tax=Myriangium duriaei CBS 260.36 TaxID=1168546 RepID=A0A9P4IX22_9PEZI|nr:hypothetical protein K461DRAFT_282768 [Myriangium duriaei CBS 260.36]
MTARIIVDQDFSTFTNLDTISGKVLLRTPKPINISTITVKLEGESRTRLIPPPTQQNERPRPQLEFHKILYKTDTLMAPDVTGRAVTIPPGEHTYPFSFKLPFNTDCPVGRNAAPAVSLSGMSVEIAHPPASHRRGPLPPTLRGFPGEAEIRYYLKATLAQPSFLKQNIRVISPFNFCPIEPPRPPDNGSEAFARKKHQFMRPHASGSKGKGLYATSIQDQGPHISVETRIPTAAILTPNQDLPLRILITSLNEQTDSMVLSTIQLDVASYTHVHAHDIVRTEPNSSIILSKSNMALPLEFRDNVCEIPRELWYGLPVQQSLPPSFETCNLSRAYELIVRVGVHFGDLNGNPQYVSFDLRHPVQMYSGIAPPPELLASLPNRTAVNSAAEAPPPLPARKPVPTKEGSAPTPANLGAAVPGSYPASSAGAPPAYAPAAPGAGPGLSGGQVQGETYADAPPSYEDAVATQMPAVQVGRRDGGYVPTPQVGGEDTMLPSDEKRGWH